MKRIFSKSSTLAAATTISRTKMVKKIVTHSGTFHADESLAIFMLKQLNEYKDAEIIRTRDAEVIAKGDVVVDVGALYDPTKNLFDHHQKEFSMTFSENHKVCRLSSAGLVYKHFGKQVIANILNWDLSDDRLNLVYEKVYLDLIESFDAIDNGVSQYPENVKSAYSNKTDISSRVARLHPAWNETEHPPLDELFLKAISMTGEELLYSVKYIANAWLPARSFVLESLESAKQVHPSGSIMILSQICPWKEHVYLLEKEMGMEGKVLYVLYEDSSKQWRVQAVPKTPNSFASRKPLPESWRGVRDDNLSTLSGIQNCIFVHATGFIGGNKTKEGALKMATDAVEKF